MAFGSLSTVQSPKVLEKKLGEDTGADLVAFKQNSNDASGRTLTAKLREFVSITDFGAVGDWDGSTGTDNTTAIQNAIDFAKGNGIGRVLVPYGEFYHTGITLEGSVGYTAMGIELIGMGKASSVLATDSDDNSFTAVTVEGPSSATGYNVGIKRLTIKNYGPSHSITGVTNANPAVVSATGHGLTTGQRVYFKDVVGMTELNYNAYTITRIDDNSYSLNSTDSSSYGTYTSGGTAKVNPHAAISFETNMSGVRIEECTLQNYRHCVRIKSDAWINRFIGLHMSGHPEYGIRMGGSGTTNTFDSCFCVGSLERGYLLTGDYSFVGVLACDDAHGDYAYEISFFNGTIGSLGNESSDVKRVALVNNSNVNIGHILGFNNTLDDANDKGGVIVGNGNNITVEQVRVVGSSSNVHDVTAVTKANPASVSATDHGLITGDKVTFDSVGGMTELNGNVYTVTRVDNDTYTLDSTDSTSYTTYTSGGEGTKTSSQVVCDFFESTATIGKLIKSNINFDGEPEGSVASTGLIISNDNSSGVCVSNDGTRRAYLGYDRGRVAYTTDDARIPGTQAVAKAIFMDMVGHPRYDSDGNDYMFGRPARVGDIFLESDPGDQHQFARVITETGTDLNGCSHERVPLELVGNTASRPTTNLRDGLQYYDTTIGKPIWYRNGNWRDAANTIV